MLESSGVALQGSFVVEREGGGYGMHDGIEVAFATGYIFADNLQRFRVVAIVARGEHVAVGIALAARAYVKVVA